MNNDLEYMREIYRFLPPGVDPGLDFTPLIFCDSYEKFRSEVWFYEEILEYDIIKQEDDKCLLWNGEEYVIILYAHLKVKEASGKEPVESRGKVIFSCRTDDIDGFYNRCKEHNIRVIEDNRQTDRRILILCPRCRYYEVIER